MEKEKKIKKRNKREMAIRDKVESKFVMLSVRFPTLWPSPFFNQSPLLLQTCKPEEEDPILTFKWYVHVVLYLMHRASL